MNKIIRAFCLPVFLLMGTSLHAQDAFQSPKLTKVWEIDSGLDVPESAYYNPYDSIIYVSNIVGAFILLPCIC